MMSPLSVGRAAKLKHVIDRKFMEQYREVQPWSAATYLRPTPSSKYRMK